MFKLQMKITHQTKNQEDLKLNLKNTINRYQHWTDKDVKLTDKVFKDTIIKML